MTSISEQVELAAWEHEPRGPGGQWISYEHGRMRTDLLPIEPTDAVRGHLAPRRYDLEELVRSIQENGVREPIAIRHNSEGSFIANGRHRAVAARIAGVPEVPVIVQHADGVNPRSLPLRGRRPANLHDWMTHYKRPVGTELSIVEQALELAFNPAEPRNKQGEWTRSALAAMSPAEKKVYISTGTLPDRPPGIAEQASVPASGVFSGDALWMSGEGEVHDISLAEKKAAKAVWYRDTYSYTNDYLRNGTKPSDNIYAQARKDLPEPEHAYIRDIGVFRGLIQRAPRFSRPAQMYRGIISPDAVFGPVGSRTGKTFSDPGFVSATVKQDEAAEYSGDGDHVTINVPAGSQVLRAEPEFFVKGGSDYAKNQEYTFAPGTRFRVDADKIVNGVRQTTITVLDTGTPGLTPPPHDTEFYRQDIGYGQAQLYNAETGQFVRNVKGFSAGSKTPDRFVIQPGDLTWDDIQLADAWEHEKRDWHGRWTRGEIGYELPDPDRLVNPNAGRGQYKSPADHPFFLRHPVSPANVIAAWDEATPEQRDQGMRWYEDAHLVAQALGKTYLNGDTARAAGVISAFSPQTGWGTNLINAARVAETGDALSFKGQATGAMKANAQKALNGEPIDEAFPSAKTNSFAHLIANGGDRQGDKLGEVVVDRHALDIATGDALTDAEGDLAPIGKTRWHEYVADQYRLAARAISRQEGQTIAPHQVQAVTWLVRQAEAEAADRAAVEAGKMDPAAVRLVRGRVTRTRNAWRNWSEYAREHNIPVEPGTTFRAEPITAAEARGNSRPVSDAEFQSLAAEGLRELQQLSRDRAPVTGLDRNWPAVKESAWAEVQKSWGGATISAQTGQPLPQGADRYALTVRPQGMTDISVPETASKDEFYAAMDRALAEYRSQLELGQRYLGVFHDDDLHRIDIDPVLVVNTPHEVETIGAYTRAIGGAYHFKSGDGYWPPHVAAPELSWDSGKGLVSGTLLPAEISLGSVLSSLQLLSPSPGNLSSQVLEMTDAWKTEKRDYRGRWTRGSKNPGTTDDYSLIIDFRTDISAILKRESRKSEPNPGVTSNLKMANAQIYGGDTESTLDYLRKAWKAAHDAGDEDTAHFIEKVAKGIESTRAEQAALNKTVTDFAAKGAEVMPDLLSGGREAWTGKVIVFPNEDNPGVAGELRWNGDMGVARSVAAHLKTALDLSSEPISDPRAPQVILHELIHGMIGGSEPTDQQVMETRKRLGISISLPISHEQYGVNRQAYQDPDNGAIEEGFTELGSIQHSAEFFNRTGIGDRETLQLALGPSGPVDNPAYYRAVKSLVKDLQAHYVKLSADPRTPQQQAANRLGGEIEALKDQPELLQTDWQGGLEDAMTRIQHLGDPEEAAWVQKVMSGVADWPGKPGPVRKARSMSMSKHATLAEYADRLNDPDRIHRGDAWGAYGWQTAAALQWCQEVARTEGFSDLSKGSPGWQRIIELADEVNREGTALKTRTMANQVIRASGGIPGDIAAMDVAMRAIKGWFKPGDMDIGRDAFNRARRQVTMRMAARV
jgi:ParB-like nuclease domain